jgi:tetratricopeptide (TPR) repeat protein
VADAHSQIDRLIEVNRHAEARRLLQAAFAEAPDDPYAHTQAARIAYIEDDHELAWSHIGEALGADPAHFGARVLSHSLLVDQRRYAEAETVVLELIRENPASADLIAAYARLMLLTANERKARGLVVEALRLDPQNHDARLVAVLAATVSGEHQLANEQLADLVREYPEGVAVAYTLLNALVEQNRNREAYELGRELLRADPSDTDLVETLIALRVQTHWLALPLYPLQRWGWAAAAAIWAGAIVAFALLRQYAPGLMGWFAFGYLAWVASSWIYPPLMRRWLTWRGLR